MQRELRQMMMSALLLTDPQVGSVQGSLNWSSLDEVAHVPGDGILGCRHSLLLMGNYYTDMIKGSLPFSLVKNFPPSEMVFQIVTRLPILYLMHFLAFLHSFLTKAFK